MSGLSLNWTWCSDFSVSCFAWHPACKFHMNHNTQVLALTSFHQLENFLQSMTSGEQVNITTWTLWRFFYTSFWSAVGASWGHSSLESRRNSGPCFHLPVSNCAGIPRETSSAKFNSPGTCLHCKGSQLLQVSATRGGHKRLELSHFTANPWQYDIAVWEGYYFFKL